MAHLEAYEGTVQHYLCHNLYVFRLLT